MAPGRKAVSPRIPGGAQLHLPPSLWRVGARHGKNTGTPGSQGLEIPPDWSGVGGMSSGSRGRKPPGTAVSVPGQPSSSSPPAPFEAGGPSVRCHLAGGLRTVAVPWPPGKVKKKRRRSAPHLSSQQKRLGTLRSPSRTTAAVWRTGRAVASLLTPNGKAWGSRTPSGGVAEKRAKLLG